VKGLRFVLAMAWRESRASGRRLTILTASVAVGVAALVAINSYTDNLQDSVRRQARALLGGDLALGSGNRFSPGAESELARLVGSEPGSRLARVTRFAAMAYVPRTTGARLVQANLDWLGPVPFTEEEHEFARQIQKATGVEVKGLAAKPRALEENPEPEGGSTDVADVKTAKNYVVAALDELKAGKPITTASTTPYGCTVKYR